MLRLNVVGPVFTAQPGQSQNKSGEEVAQGVPRVPSTEASMHR